MVEMPGIMSFPDLIDKGRASPARPLSILIVLYIYNENLVIFCIHL